MVAVVALAIATRAFCYEADVTDISGNKYFPVVKEELSKAKESIFMVMFKVGLSGYDKSSSVYQLVDELAKAHKRGVKVTVILDQNIAFSDQGDIDQWETEGKNAWCFKILKEAGITVWYDDPTKYVHAKTLVIDRETAILGSANWTESALFKNFETNVLIRSKQLAKGLLESFEKIAIDQKSSNLAIETGAPVAISWKFLENPELCGNMMSRHDERSFDLYLLLLRNFKGEPKAELTLDYDETAKALGIYEPMSRTAYRRQIIKSLRKLQDRYKLIRFEPQYAQEATITLLDYEQPEKAYTYPKEWFFQLPADYWRYGWDRKLSMRAKFCYLINLAYASISNARPWWFAGRKTLTERFNVGKTVISQGMQELRRQNLIDVEYPPRDENYQSSLAKSYKPLKLYNPAWLEAEWDRLKMAYGEDELKQARAYAKIVFRENDPQVVEGILLKTKQYGKAAVKKAFAIVAQKNIDNPKRKYSYVKGIIEQSGKKEE